MDFQSLTDQQIKELNLVEPGTYKFQVLRCDQKTSRNGQEYFNLKIRLYLGLKETIIYDMLFFEGKMMFKTKHFCDAVGLEKQYLAGKLMPYECEGKEGSLQMIQNVNKQSGELESRVKDYIVPVKADGFIDDDVPNF